MGANLPFSASNYEVKGPKAQYDAYYLDLTLQGKMEGFDWEGEKKITDAEWLKVYNSICEWSKATVKSNKPDVSNLPASDFDLIKQFYPQLNFRELETPFSVDEVGSNFPYSNMKAMLTAAMNGKLAVPGYTAASVTSLEATEVRADLNKLKESTMKKVDDVFADAMKFATAAYPDEDAKKHYQKLRAKLGDFPQTPQAWEVYRANVEKEADEMARLASKREDPHHHGGHDEEHGDDHHHEAKLSPAQEFEAKYSRNLEQMQERMNRFKNDPEGFMEASIIEKYGKAGLDVWNKSQEFSKNMSVMSPADKLATENKFADFLKNA